MSYYGSNIVRKISNAHKQYLKTLLTPDDRSTQEKSLRKKIVELFNDFVNNKEDIMTDNEYLKFSEAVDDAIVANFQRWGEKRLEERSALLDDIDELIFTHPYKDVRVRLWSLVDIWAITYKGPVAKLADIVNSEQSVHTREVEKKTNDGIHILSNMEIPQGQKTLKEIQKAFRKSLATHKYNDKNLRSEVDILQKKVHEDMKDWGNREAVMRKDENVYRAVLRGLWAKIKKYSYEIKSELIKRLWEECNESIGLCADGHVGRLVNVLAGFDDNFQSQMSPMEYFQHNIALIAGNEGVAMKFKVEQAKKLMDEIAMPEGEREAWLSAL
jgi:hypothetical protein